MTKKPPVLVIVGGTVLLMVLGIFLSTRAGKKPGVNLPTVSEERSGDPFVTQTGKSMTSTVLKEADSQVKSVLQEVFGGAKLTAFLEAGEKDSQTVEYTLKRKVENRDLEPILQAFIKRGFTEEYKAQQEGTTSLGVRNSSFMISLSYEAGDQKVMAILATAASEE